MNIQLNTMGRNLQKLTHWCLDHPIQSMLLVIAVMMISSLIHLLAQVCFLVFVISIIYMILRDMIVKFRGPGRMDADVREDENKAGEAQR